MSLATVELSRILDRTAPDANGHKVGEVLLMSSSLLTDRMFLYSDFLPTLSRKAVARMWVTSAKNPRFRDLWQGSDAIIEEFPKVRPFKEFPYNYLRRLNEFTWDYRHRPPSRMSMMRHVRDRNMNALVRTLKLPARLLALAGVEQVIEDKLEKLLLSFPRSEAAFERMSVHRPDVVVTTGPFQFEQPGVVAAARKLNIPTLALIPSWDNISTKNRMVLKYDGYIVWSERTKQELHEFYPATRDVPIYVVGAPQFDVFFDREFELSREEFFLSQGLDPKLPTIVYALGSPNFLQEHHGALEFARRVAQGQLGEMQLIVRPHPIHDNAEMLNLFRQFGRRVHLQQTAQAGTALTARSQDQSQVTEWVNTFRHADVVINLSSTVTVDAAIFDRPVVNIDFDPEPGQPNQQLVKDVNHLWTHFKPIAESGGVWLVNNMDEMAEAVKGYIAKPSLHREKRRWITEYVCGHLDGRCGMRLADAMLDFMSSRARATGTN